MAHLAAVALHDRPAVDQLPAGFADDASGLERARIRRVVLVPAGEEAALAAIRAALAEARAAGVPVSIAGARHSMGGQTIAREGIVLDTREMARMELDEPGRVLHVQAGARWDAVLPLLDAHGLSVAVMQSNNVFSVGGSISVNCHGWEPGHAPIASSVRAFRIVLADGSLVPCSRTENAELFALALGGYGLFGVILDVELVVVANEAYRAERFVLPTADYVATLEREALRLPETTGMAFGRLSIAADGFLEEAILTVFQREDGAPIPELEAPGQRWLKRLFLRGSVRSDYGKRLRWSAEKALGSALGPGLISRNQILHDDLAVLENGDPGGTDILQEYFVPPEAFGGFVERLRAGVCAHDADLLNVTVRDVRRDADTFLRYAERDMLALVLFFHQERSLAADARMQPLTRDLIDAALAAGGTYYLPYRLHATREQFRAAYPMADEFFARKRAVDPGDLFRNELYERYGR